MSVKPDFLKADYNFNLLNSEADQSAVSTQYITPQK